MVALLLFIFPLGTSVLFHNSGSTLYWRPQCRRLLSSPSSLCLCQLFFLKDIPSLICIFLIIRELSILDTHGSEHWPHSMSGLEKGLLLFSAQSQSGILATEFSNSLYTLNINLSDIQSASNIFQFTWLAILLIISFVELFNAIFLFSPTLFSFLLCSPEVNSKNSLLRSAIKFPLCFLPGVVFKILALDLYPFWVGFCIWYKKRAFHCVWIWR